MEKQRSGPVLVLVLVTLAVYFMFRGQQSAAVPASGAESQLPEKVPVASSGPQSARQLVKEASSKSGDSAETREFTVVCVDSEGHAAAGARLLTRSGSTLALVPHVADASGRYSGLFVGPVVSVRAFSPGIGEGSVAITEDDLDRDITLVLESLATLEVRVLGESGQPQVSVEVSVAVIGAEATAGMLPKAPSPELTDPTGRCSFRLNPQGIYRVRAKTLDGVRSPAQKVHLRVGGKQSITITLGASLTIHGHVRDGNGRGIEGAAVSGVMAADFFQPSPQIRPTVTGSDGSFALAVPRLGQYRVVASHRDYALESIRLFEVELPDRKATCELRMQPVELIRGRVVDGGGQACAGIQVAATPRVDPERGYNSRNLDTLFLRDPDTGRYLGQNAATTDASGRFALPVIPWLAGQWSLIAHGARGPDTLFGVLDAEVTGEAFRELVLTVGPVGKAESSLRINVRNADASKLVGLKNNRQRGVWLMEWDSLTINREKDNPVIEVPVAALHGAIAVRSGEASCLLIGTALQKALESTEITLEQNWPVSFELRDKGGAQQLAVVGAGRYRVTVQHESGCVLPPSYLVASPQTDAGTAHLPRGSYSAVFQDGWRVITTTSFRVPDDGRIISARW